MANVLARSVDSVVSFFNSLRSELAFYKGCLNLQTALVTKGEPVCTPVPMPADRHYFRATGLYDPCLSLRTDGRTVGNDLDADSKALVVVTGANRGGKTTFLRSVGLAHLMMQCGMFVAARSFSAGVRLRGLYSFQAGGRPLYDRGEVGGGTGEDELRHFPYIAGVLIAVQRAVRFNERAGRLGHRPASLPSVG